MPVLPATDTSVQIPRAVLAAAARANEIYAQVHNPPADPAAQDPVVDTPVTPQGNEPSAASAAPAEQPPAAPKDTDWEGRYKAMKGRYDNEKKRWEERFAQITDELRALRSQVVAAPRVAPELQAERLIKQEEIQDYGSEFLDVVGRKAKEELLPELAEMKQSLQHVQQQLGLSAQERLFQSLEQQVPNWRELNTDQAFLAWLKLPDPYSGAIRQDMLSAAFEAQHAPRVIAFFKGFLSEEAATAPGHREVPKPSAAAPGKLDLADFAAPGRAKTAAAPAPAEKPLFTRDQISAFYREKTKGSYRGREAEADAVERQIVEAIREGRIR